MRVFGVKGLAEPEEELVLIVAQGLETLEWRPAKAAKKK
jgi:hypothetical protein